MDIPPLSDHEELDLNADSDDEPPILRVRPYGGIPKNAQIIRYSDEEDKEFTTEKKLSISLNPAHPYFLHCCQPEPNLAKINRAPKPLTGKQFERQIAEVRYHIQLDAAI